jgi:very-short-patch-repair endonuclease
MAPGQVTNGPTETMNAFQKRIKRIAFGMTNFRHWRIRVLLYAGRPTGRNSRRSPHDPAEMRRADTFTKASGTSGALTDWLAHCEQVAKTPRQAIHTSRMGQIDSEFEAEVAQALRERGVEVVHQYPACGFNIDLVCTLDGERIAVECDGEYYHHDEHGQLRIEDVERQAVLERAGWRVARIAYRKWMKDPYSEVQRILALLRGQPHEDGDDAATNRVDEPIEEREITREQALRI